MPAQQERIPGRAAGLPVSLAILWALLFTVWLIINATTELSVLTAGALVSGVLSWIFLGRSNVWHLALSPRKLFHFLAYTGVFVVEMVKANINMMRYVYAPRIDIHPGIVKINVRLRSPIGRLALANSIALTPGSLVMDIRGDAMFIHWLDVKTIDPVAATAMIAGPFEKHLEAVFG
jgi:multicomponent Na+:H+ antiporter subunit E